MQPDIPVKPMRPQAPRRNEAAWVREAKRVAELYETGQYTLVSVLNHLEIVPASFFKAMRNHPEVNRIYQAAKNNATKIHALGNLENCKTALAAMLKPSLSTEIKVVKRKNETTGEMEIVEEHVVTKTVPPNPRAVLALAEKHDLRP